MKTRILAILGLLLALSLTACNKDDGPSNTVAVGPKACTQYRYDQNSRQFYDSNNSIVSDCNRSGLFGPNNNYLPGGNYGKNGCDAHNYNPRYNGAYYVPMYLNGERQLVCVNTELFNQHRQNAQFNYYYQNHGSMYPTHTCTPGVNCQQNRSCINIGGSRAGSNGVLGGQFGFCWK